MNIVCSNCHTGHNITLDEINSLHDSVLHCKNCSKNIKIQFCPHCNAFYSITFSNIKSGNYTYRCKKCNKPFSINFDSPHSIKKQAETEVSTSVKQAPPAYEEKAVYREESPIKESEHSDYISRDSIHKISISELFTSVQKAFSPKKIISGATGVVIILLLSRLFSALENYISLNGAGGSYTFLSSFINLFPLAIIFSVFILTASVISKITLNEIFIKSGTGNDEIISYALKSTPSILTGNIAVLLLINTALILFGKIPFLGPFLFSLIFLPLYIVSIAIFLITFVGIWFYPSIAAHRENGILKNIMNLMVFIKKHNFRLLATMPVMTALSIVAFGIIFIIHSSSLALALSASRAVLNSDASVFFSSIPAAFIKASEFSLSGIDSSIFKGLYSNISFLTETGGLILGISMLAITVLLLSTLISIIATISTHFYVMLERGLNIEDRKNLTVLSVLVLLLTVIIQLKKIF